MSSLTEFNQEGGQQAANSNNPIDTVVIPVGGLGTRMFPITVATPKNLLPLGETTLIDIAVDEAMLAGANKIVIVCSPNDLEKYEAQFNPTDAQWAAVQGESKARERAALESLAAKSDKITFVIQEKPKGLGHAVLQAKEHVKGNFGVILPDDAILDSQLSPVGLKSLADCYEGGVSLARVQVPMAETSRYGVFDFGEQGVDTAQKTQLISGVVEKPKENAPSNFAIMGRYILPPEIFEILAEETVGAGNEIQLTDAIEELILNGTPAYATEYEGTRLDCGTREGYAAAQSFVNEKLFPQLKPVAPEVAEPETALKV